MNSIKPIRRLTKGELQARLRAIHSKIALRASSCLYREADLILVLLAEIEEEENLVVDAFNPDGN